MKSEGLIRRVTGRLTQLIAMTGPAGGWRKTIIDKSIAYVLTPYSLSEGSKVSTSFRWSAKHGPCPAGDPGLHHYVGELLYKGYSSRVLVTFILIDTQRCRGCV